MNVEDILLIVDKCDDVGEAKKLRIKAYVRKSFKIKKQNKIDLHKLYKMSRKEIMEERRKLWK